MKRDFTISPSDLSLIAAAANVWLRNHTNEVHNFEKQIELTKQLQKELNSTAWDEDAMLVIMEVPF